jgi:dihydrofolate reductase
MPGTALWHVTMSLDGFIAGPGDENEWAFQFGRPGPIAQETIEATGAILAGRRGYDLGNRKGGGSRGIYGGAWNGPMFVLTHRPGDTPEDADVTLLSGGIEDAVATARAAAAGRSVGIFGASVARQCLEHGLLDEIVVHLAPVLLGEGVRFYDAPGVGEIRLERTDLFEPGQITDLRFRVLH